MNVVYARNDHPGILITCPNCRMAARHDPDDIGDAIGRHTTIECVICGKPFRVFVEVASNNDPAGPINCEHGYKWSCPHGCL